MPRLDRWMRPLAWATLVANAVLVVTGGAVRLTASGLGCPTWPRCTDKSFTPHGALDAHSAIEFGNRMLTFVLAAVAVATFVAAWQTGRRELRTLALVLGLGIPAQAVIGGITVLTDLNPWVVSLHLLLSLAMIGLAVLLIRRLDHPQPTIRSGPTVTLAWLTFAAAWLVMYVGTVVTGSGPHAGDIRTERNGLDPVQVSQLHADAVFLLVGLTVGLLLALLAVDAPTRRHPGGRGAARDRAGPGPDRVRPVLHRPADRARRLPHARRRPDLRGRDLGSHPGPRELTRDTWRRGFGLHPRGQTERLVIAVDAASPGLVASLFRLFCAGATNRRFWSRPCLWSPGFEARR